VDAGARDDRHGLANANEQKEGSAMASSEIRGNDSAKAPEAAPPPDHVGDAEAAGVDTDEDRSARRFTSSRVIGAVERERLLQEARDVDFPTGLRGYDRAAVDRYVERLTRLITELEMSSSPESAIRHALDEVSEETRDILHRAHQTADEITTRARAKADERLQQAEHDAHEMLASARNEAQEIGEAARNEAEQIGEAARQDAQQLSAKTSTEVDKLRATSQREADELRDTTMREIAELRETASREAHQLRTTAQREADDARGSARRQADEMLEAAETHARDLTRSAEAIWHERRRLLDDMRSVGEQLVGIGELEAKRFPRPVDELIPGAEHAAEEVAR
jgi:DivIVA domain-containing protein